MGSMWIGTLLAAIDGTMVASILGTVGSEFQVSKEIQWLGVSLYFHYLKLLEITYYELFLLDFIPFDSDCFSTTVRTVQ
jgi:hypothetical protein